MLRLGSLAAPGLVAALSIINSGCSGEEEEKGVVVAGRLSLYVHDPSGDPVPDGSVATYVGADRSQWKVVDGGRAELEAYAVVPESANLEDGYQFPTVLIVDGPGVYPTTESVMVAVGEVTPVDIEVSVVADQEGPRVVACQYDDTAAWVLLNEPALRAASVVARPICSTERSGSGGTDAAFTVDNRVQIAGRFDCTDVDYIDGERYETVFTAPAITISFRDLEDGQGSVSPYIEEVCN
jgi:hypothetical protein